MAGLHPPPPAAAPLSLKARQHASQALQHIFLHHLAAAASSPPDLQPTTGPGMRQDTKDFRSTPPQNCCSQSDVDEMAHLRNLVEASPQDSHGTGPPARPSSAFRPLKQQSEYSSTAGRCIFPASEPAQNKMECSQSKQEPAIADHSNARLQSSQLTIFYSGIMNVYEDVPANEAHAIMLLAGSGGSSCSSHLTDGRSTAVSSSSLGAATAPIAMSAAMRTRDPGTFFSPPVESSAPTFSCPFPVATSKEHFGTRFHTELPFARKASMARFLEKRKDRATFNPVENVHENDEQPPSLKRPRGFAALTSTHNDWSRPSRPLMIS